MDHHNDFSSNGSQSTSASASTLNSTHPHTDGDTDKAGDWTSQFLPNSQHQGQANEAKAVIKTELEYLKSVGKKEREAWFALRSQAVAKSSEATKPVPPVVPAPVAKGESETESNHTDQRKAEAEQDESTESWDAPHERSCARCGSRFVGALGSYVSSYASLAGDLSVSASVYSNNAVGQLSRWTQYGLEWAQWGHHPHPYPHAQPYPVPHPMSNFNNGHVYAPQPQYPISLVNGYSYGYGAPHTGYVHVHPYSYASYPYSGYGAHGHAYGGYGGVGIPLSSSPSVVATNGPLATAAQESGLSAVEELRLLKQQVSSLKFSFLCVGV